MDFLRGLHHAPWIVGLVRGVVLAGAVAVVSFLLGWFENPPAELAFYAPIAIYLLRQAEAVLDQLDPRKSSSGHDLVEVSE